jgi:Tfp pilus assembly protein PilF
VKHNGECGVFEFVSRQWDFQIWVALLDRDITILYILNSMTTMQPPRFTARRFSLFALLGFCFLRLAAPLAAQADDAKDVWVEVRSPHFIVSSNAGEKQARHVAQQFEEIRGLFQSNFPTLRLDPGKPILILAAKNENTLKILLPGFWEQKGSVHPAGLYTAGPEKHYVALRLDSQDENPFHVLYHEYTHALLHLNYRPLPLWLDEGFAEFYGNTVINGKDIQTGKVDKSHLYLLQQSKLLPVDILLQVDHSSPYYNEQNRASVFYAESWALVHFLLLDPDARKQQLLIHFLAAWDKSGNQVQAAQQTFGDLKKFGQRIEAYARQQTFYMAVIKSSLQFDEKSYTSRALSSAESLALRGDFYLHTNRMQEANTALEEAVKQDSQLAAAHESLGNYYFRQRDQAAAAREFERATQLNSSSFLTYYDSAMLDLQMARGMPDAWPKAEANLEKAISLNPAFAPAYASLANLYSFRGQNQDKALAAARRAVELEPGAISYSINLGYVLLNMNKMDEARALASHILAGAKNPVEMQSAHSFQDAVEGRGRMSARLAASPDQDADDAESREPVHPATQTQSKEAEDLPPEPVKKAEASVPTAAPNSTEPDGPVNVTQGMVYEMSGKITVLNCSQTPEVYLTLALSSIEMKLHANDLTKVQVKDSARAARNAPTGCLSWKSRNARMSYHLTPGKNYDGEIISVQLD